MRGIHWAGLLLLASCGGSQTSSTTPASSQLCPPADSTNFAEGVQQIVVRHEEAVFGPCPKSTPFACEMAVLEGSPREPVLFTIRIRSTEPWVMPPHTHPRGERVTVLSGKISVGFGPNVDKTAGKTFGPGDYYVNAPESAHFVWADEPVEIQITGIGPWEIHPLK